MQANYNAQEIPVSNSLPSKRGALCLLMNKFYKKDVNYLSLKELQLKALKTESELDAFYSTKPFKKMEFDTCVVLI